jgi:maltose O-acetyltransferase
MNKDRLFFFIQSLLKYNTFQLGIYLRSVLYRPFFKSFGKNIQIKDGVTFKYPSEIELGDNTVVGENCYFVGKKGLKLGSYVLIGAGSKIITSTHNYKDLVVPIVQQGLSFSSVEIGSNVWLGFDVKILAGSKIPEGSIVATNSVVNCRFEEANLIIAGTPAVIKGKRGSLDEIGVQT